MNRYYHKINQVLCNRCNENININTNYCNSCNIYEIISICTICNKEILQSHNYASRQICENYINAANHIINYYRKYKLKQVIKHNLEQYCHHILGEICGFCNEPVKYSPFFDHGNIRSACLICHKIIKGLSTDISYRLCSIYLNAINKIKKCYKKYKLKQILKKININNDCTNIIIKFTLKS